MTKLNGLTDNKTKQLKAVLGEDSVKKDVPQGFGLHNLELEGFIELHIYYDSIQVVRETEGAVVEIARDEFDTLLIF